MQWVYIIKCEKGIIYVGETKNLMRRLTQHKNGGCTRTLENKAIELIGLYKVNVNYNFLKYIEELNEGVDLIKMREYLFNMGNYSLNRDFSLYVENYFAEYMIKLENDGKLGESRIYGGKYTKYERNERNMIFNEEKYKRPICLCGLPCEVNKSNLSKKAKINFTCCMRNVWKEMREEFNVIDLGKGCNYYREFLDDIETRVEIFSLVDE